jgi:hypothetical protein
MPGVSGVTVVTNARAYYQYTRGCGRIGRPAFPAPSDWRVKKLMANLGHIRPRDREIAAARMLLFEIRIPAVIARLDRATQ